MTSVAFIGFGEAAAAFARPGDRAYDIKSLDPGAAIGKQSDYADAGVIGCPSAREAMAGASLVLSLVTADAALRAAIDYAPFLESDALWLDMNSVAPGTKRKAAAAIEAVGGHYADVAVMAPVHPARLAVPLLVAGDAAGRASDGLRAIGFTSVATCGGQVGDASAIKMIRSVMVKGLEALSAECILAADRAGVSAAVLASLDASWRTEPWAARVDYSLDRMMAHGTRRAAEMEEAARTLEELGVDPVMTRGTIVRQRAAGALGIAPPAGFEAKLAAMGEGRKDEAA